MKPNLQIHNKPILKQIRKDLRNNLTPAEAELWKHLKNSALEHRKFRRQHSVGNYVLDFYCPQEHLAVELDGQGHFTSSGQEYDSERIAYLNSVGICVLRFENKYVFTHLEEVLVDIRAGFKLNHP